MGELVGTVLDGKYRITGKIGAGSMGDVYDGREDATGRRVAIKVLKPERASRDVHRHRFLREAKSTLMIPHENVVEVLEVGATEGGLLYFSMEYLQGEDLGALLRRRKHLAWDQTREILLQVARGLQAAHRQGVVHRDIKPSNILLLAGHDPPVVKIVDFGVAKLGAGMVSRVLTAAADVVGTVLYMSPEQAEGRPADERSDIYALGVMAYETVVGRVPFPGNDIFKVMAAHMRDDPTPPAELVPEIPEYASDFIMTCLRKRPEDRYPSMDVVLDALEGRATPDVAGPPAQRPSRLDAGLKTPIGEEVTRLAVAHPTAPTISATPVDVGIPNPAEASNPEDFDDQPTAYYRPLPPPPPQAVTPRVVAHPGASGRGLTVPMPTVPPEAASHASGANPITQISGVNLVPPNIMGSGHTERMEYIPPDDPAERTSTPTIVVVILILLAAGVGLALAGVVL